MYVFKSYIIKLKREIIEPLTACYKPEALHPSRSNSKMLFCGKNSCVYM